VPDLMRLQRAIMIAVSYRLIARGARIDWPGNTEHLISSRCGVNIFGVVDDKLAEALNDVLAILRAWYRSEPSKRVQLAASAKALTEAIAAMKSSPVGSDEHRTASAQADAALNDACNAMHYNASFEPVFGAATSHLRKVKDRR
jgi:hypothetical protein